MSTVATEVSQAQRIAPGVMLRRALRVGTIDKEKRTVEVAFSSDVELKRWGEIEVLSHAPGAVDMTRMEDGAAVLFNHNFDTQLGVVESARIDPDGKGRAVVRFGNGTFAEEKWRDVQDGILKHISVGYKIEEVKLNETRSDGTDVYVVNRWQPYEISFVTVPADPTVGVGRNLNTASATAQAPVEKSQKPTITMSANPTAENQPAGPDLAVETRKASDAEFSRVRSILEIGKKYELADLAQEFVSERRSEAEFKEAVLTKMQERTKTLKSSGEIGMSDKEARKFSFVRLLASAADPKNHKLHEAAAYEREVCEAAAKASHRSVAGMSIPLEVLRTPLDAELSKRADVLSVKTGTGYTGTGSATVATTLLASSFVDLLRPRTFIMRRASVLGGLVGNFDIPKQVTGASGYWIGEDDPAGQSDVDFGLISLNPKTASGFVDVTRKMLMQSSLDVEALVRLDLAKGLAQTIDKAGLYGTGANGQPKGLKLYDGINAVDFSGVNPTYAELVEMESQIAADNADVNSMAYVVNSGMRGYTKSTLKFSGVSGTIWEPGDSINGYGTEVTNQVTAGDVFFGNWSDFWAAMWGGLELNVDPYSHSTRGRIRVIAMQDVDFAVRRVESFTYGKQLTP
jgi:HK97 family phage major capsid protein/HK97 family phage prohead protease